MARRGQPDVEEPGAVGGVTGAVVRGDGVAAHVRDGPDVRGQRARRAHGADVAQAAVLPLEAGAAVVVLLCGNAVEAHDPVPGAGEGGPPGGDAVAVAAQVGADQVEARKAYAGP
ncbi:hypothetical protein SMD44_07559 [Streptomyces alboflavus]|uniref:Uncharacterized protein n=1 Tax=Streptomyces alboflavus TaxID=67267 RepID=A0A1Z1WP49_9ACTN|nr:hypothetical protein SMD44_07559 [Streptomyces alboflavus]